MVETSVPYPESLENAPSIAGASGILLERSLCFEHIAIWSGFDGTIQ